MNLLISDPTNIRYLTGFVSVEPQAREAYALVTPPKTYLFTNSLYKEQAKKLGVPVIEISRDNPLSQQLKPFVGKQLAFEETDITVSEYNELKKYFALVPTHNKIEMRRMIKKNSEIASIRKAAQITAQCFSQLHLKPGATESQVAWEIELFIRSKGATLAFSPIVAFGTHTSQPHYQMSDGRLQTSDIVLLDFGARVNGYCADMTRVIFVGRPKAEWVKAYETVLSANKKALDALKKRERHGAKLDSIARSTIKNFPPYSHSLGHGVGLDIHEAPRLTVKKNEILKPGMVITIEPAIYIEGRFGIRIEDLVLLKKDSIEILSKSPKMLIAIE